MKFKIAKGRTAIMGILNVTPDSFYDGGRHSKKSNAVEHALSMFSDGADIVDVGGESTRPGARPITAKEELSRVVPVIEKILSKVEKPLSIDSYKPDVVEAALSSGASMINDVYGLRTPGMIDIAAEYDVPIVIMHMKGTPKTMQEKPTYKDVVSEIKEFFRERVSAALDGGVKKRNIILDPGIGFGKTLAHNVEILRRLPEFSKIGFPLMVGASRKRMIGELLNLPPEERLEGSLAVGVYSILQGASILRVHDVRETVRAAKVADALARGI
jgi:dihydropteroate synthase